MLNKFTIFALMALMLGSISAQGEIGTTVIKFSYSDDLQKGDIFIWDVSSNFTIQEDFFEDGSVIKLEILQNLAGVVFEGNLASTNLENYFAVQFGSSSFVSDQESIHTVVFPNSVTLDNGTIINDPFQGIWIDVIIDSFEFNNAEVSVSYIEDASGLEINATIKYKESVFDASADISAKFDTKLGIMKEYHIFLDLPGFGGQSIDVLQRDVSDPNNGAETTDDEAAPLNFIWFILPIFVFPIIKKYRK